MTLKQNQVTNKDSEKTNMIINKKKLPKLPFGLEPTTMWIESNFIVLVVDNGNYISRFRWDGYSKDYNSYDGSFLKCELEQ